MKWMERLLPESLVTSRELMVKAKLLGLLNGAATLMFALVTLNEMSSTNSWYAFGLRAFALFLMGMSLVLLFMAENYKASANFFIAAICSELFPPLILADKPLLVNIYWFSLVPLAAILLTTRRNALVWSIIIVFGVIAQLGVNLSFGLDHPFDLLKKSKTIFAENVLRHVAFFFVAVGYSFFSKPNTKSFGIALGAMILLTGLNLTELQPWSVFQFLTLLLPFFMIKSLNWIHLGVLYTVPVVGNLIMNHFYQLNHQPYPYSLHVYYYQTVLLLGIILLSMMLAFRFNLLVNQSDIIEDGANI